MSVTSVDVAASCVAKPCVTPGMASFRHIAGALGPPPGPYDADIIILALDRADETLAAIASALSQQGVSRHVFILDQGSRPDMLARLAQAIAGRDDATLVLSAVNLGVAGGRNAATALGHGRVIVGLDNDATFDTDLTVLHLVSALDDDPGLAAIACRIVNDTTGADDLTSWGYPRSLLGRAHETWTAATFVGAGHAIRRAAWDDAGGYDAALFFCWEELDFCLRAVSRGWRVLYRGDLPIRHKVAAEQRVTWSDRRWFYFVRNRVYIDRKYRVHWAAMLPRLAAYVLRGARQGLLFPTLRAFLAAHRLAGTVPGQRLGSGIRYYVWLADGMHRESWPRRAWQELLAACGLDTSRHPGARSLKANPSET